MMHIITIAIMLGIFYYFNVYKANVEDRESEYEQSSDDLINTDEIGDKEMERCLDDRTITGLVQDTLKMIGCEPKMEESGKNNWFMFTYQGEKFCVECNDESSYINIYDNWWHGLSIYSDVEEIADLHRIINWANQYVNCTLLYTTNQEIEEIGVHSKKNILFIKEIPNLGNYLLATLDDFFKVQRFVLTELEKCKVTETK